MNSVWRRIHIWLGADESALYQNRIRFESLEPRRLYSATPAPVDAPAEPEPEEPTIVESTPTPSSYATQKAPNFLENTLAPLTLDEVASAAAENAIANSPPNESNNAPLTIQDDFNRPDGATVGNGWMNVEGVVGEGWLDTAEVGTSLEIVDNQVIYRAESGEDGRIGPGVAGIYRPINILSDVTVEVTLYEKNGFGDLLRRFDHALGIRSSGENGSGYTLHLSRSDALDQASALSLFDGEELVARKFVDNQYGPSVMVRATFSLNGRVSGELRTNNQVEEFSFGPREIQSNGSNFIYITAGSSGIVKPRMDDLSISSMPIAHAFDYPIGDRGIDADGRPYQLSEYVYNSRDNWNSHSRSFASESNGVYLSDSFLNPSGDNFEAPFREGRSTNGWFNAQDVGSFERDFVHRIHAGEDWNLGTGRFDVGQPVYAVADGVISMTRSGSAIGITAQGGNPQNGDYYHWGYHLIVDHQLPDGRVIQSVYAHIVGNRANVSPNDPFPNDPNWWAQDGYFDFEVGDPVSRGQMLGVIAPISIPPHLDFTIRLQQDTALNAYYGNRQPNPTPTYIEQAYREMADGGVVDASDFIDRYRRITSDGLIAEGLYTGPEAATWLTLDPAGSPDDGYLYFVDNPESATGGIYRISRNGGPVETILSTEQIEDSALSRDPRDNGVGLMFFTDDGQIVAEYGGYRGDSFFTIQPDGGNFSDGPIHQWSRGALLGVIGDRVYFGQGFSTIDSIPINGGEVTDSGLNSYWPRSAVVHEDAIYFIDSGRNEVFRWGPDSPLTQVTQLGNISTTGESGKLFASRDAVYFVHPGLGADKGLYRITNESGQSRAELIYSSEDIRGIVGAADERYAYVIEGFEGDLWLTAISVTGAPSAADGAVVPLRRISQSGFWGEGPITVDHRYVYWAERTENDSLVQRIQKPGMTVSAPPQVVVAGGNDDISFTIRLPVFDSQFPNLEFEQATVGSANSTTFDPNEVDTEAAEITLNLAASFFQNVMADFYEDTIIGAFESAARDGVVDVTLANHIGSFLGPGVNVVAEPIFNQIAFAIDGSDLNWEAQAARFTFDVSVGATISLIAIASPQAGFWVSVVDGVTRDALFEFLLNNTGIDWVGELLYDRYIRIEPPVL